MGKLPWEYCECGCHCLVATVGPYSVTLFDPLRKGLKVCIWEGSCYSKMREPDGKYDTTDEAFKAAEALMQKLVNRDKKDLAAWGKKASRKKQATA